MLARSFRFTGTLLATLALVATPACKKKKVEEVKKDLPVKKQITETPLPEGAVGEIVIKDPEAFAKRFADAAGLGAMVGPSPYQKILDSVTDENAKRALNAIDPHGTMAAVLIAKIAPNEKPHGVIAARLKDPDIAAAALAAASKAGAGMKTWSSTVLETVVYEPDKEGEVAIYGDVVLVADQREALESAGKYVAWRSVGSKLDHELILRVPMAKVGPELKKLGLDEWAKVKPSPSFPAKVKGEIDPLVDPVLTAVADMGEMVVNLDIDGDLLVADEKLEAKKSFSEWLKKYPTGDASPLLTMPKGESVALYRYPDGLGGPIYALVEWGLDSSPLTAAERTDASKQLRAFGKSLGHAVAYVTDTGHGPAPTTPSLNTDVLIRFDLDDPAATKTSVPALRKVIEKIAGGTKPTSTPYKKFGAEGETIAIPAVLPMAGAGTTKDAVVWAIKDKWFFFELCLGCTPALLDAALDPAAKGTLDADPTAKAKIATYPATGVVSASYGTTFSFPGAFGGLGAFMGAPAPAKKPTAPLWGWSTADANGIVAKGAIPLGTLGQFLQSYLLMAGMGMPGGPGGGGGMPPF